MYDDKNEASELFLSEDLRTSYDKYGEVIPGK